MKYPGKLPLKFEKPDEKQAPENIELTRNTRFSGENHADGVLNMDEFNDDERKNEENNHMHMHFEFGGGDEDLGIMQDGLVLHEHDNDNPEMEKIDEEEAPLDMELDLTLAPVNDMQANMNIRPEREQAPVAALHEEYYGGSEDHLLSSSQYTTAAHKWHPHTVKVLKALRKSMEDKVKYICIIMQVA